MPLKSKAQQRFMFAAESRGELKPGTARQWARHTPDMKKLPERVDSEKEAGLGQLLNVGLGRVNHALRGGAMDTALKTSLKKFAPHTLAAPITGQRVPVPPKQSWLQHLNASAKKDPETLSGALKQVGNAIDMRPIVAGHIPQGVLSTPLRRLGAVLGLGAGSVATDVGIHEFQQLMTNGQSKIAELTGDVMNKNAGLFGKQVGMLQGMGQKVSAGANKANQAMDGGMLDNMLKKVMGQAPMSNTPLQRAGTATAAAGLGAVGAGSALSGLGGAGKGVPEPQMPPGPVPGGEAAGGPLESLVGKLHSVPGQLGLGSPAEMGQQARGLFDQARNSSAGQAVEKSPMVQSAISGFQGAEQKNPGLLKGLGIGAAGAALGAGAGYGVGSRKKKPKEEKKMPTKEAVDGVVRVLKEVYTKCAAETLIRHLDDVAQHLPLEKQASVRLVQAGIASRKPLSHAIKVAYPWLSGEQRGFLASNMIRSALAVKQATMNSNTISTSSPTSCAVPMNKATNKLREMST